MSEGFTEFHGYNLWYRIAGPAGESSTAPILLLHGGPGGSSDILEPLDALADQGRTVIRFDQLGCGRSDRPRDLSLWTISSCIEQINAIRESLGLDQVHLLGHSWGCMVGLEYLLTSPPGVQSICLSSPVVSAPLWVEEARRLLSQMPAHLEKAMRRCEQSYQPRKPPEAGVEPAPTLTQADIERQSKSMAALLPFMAHPLSARLASWMSYLPPLRPTAYGILNLQFVRRHIFRLQPIPPGILNMLAGGNGEIYEVLWGASEFFATGLLKDWDFRPHLSHIQLPTLILSGLYDVATPAQMAIFKDGIRGSEQLILQQSSHCGMWEEPEKYQAAILDFINRVEAASHSNL